MTREARVDEIADYVAYLDRLHEVVNGEFPAKSVCVLGFSQGAATAFRWAALGAVRFERVVSWAGGLPPDLELTGCETLRGTRCELVLGERDRFFDGEQAETARARLDGVAASVEVMRFAGGHRMDRELLAELFD